jgi:hypothetical protein
MRVRALAIAILWMASAAAQAADVHGRLELQDFAAFARSDSIDALLGARDRNDVAGNLRLTWEPRWDSWTFSLHYLLQADYGDGVRLARAQAGFITAPPPTLFDLTTLFYDRANLRSEQRIDRLSIGYAGPDLVVRIGRQALTWGGGLVFRPMDLFDPFAPNATDTEFKPGTDMVYVQRLFADGSDLQAIIVPRSAVNGGGPSANASSLALLLHKSIGELQTSWLVARDHGDWTAAADIGGSLGGASWDVELIPVFPTQGAARISALANISDAITLFDRNATLFAEIFHNGFGTASARATFATLPSDLLDRLSRGQLFSLRKNYLAAGMTVEWTPLLNLSPTVIANLDDGSLYALVGASWSLAENVTLVGGAQVPIGPRGSEFGGLRLTPATATIAGPAPQLYIELRRYF